MNLTPADKQQVVLLAQRRAALGLPHSYAETIRSAVGLALTISDDSLARWAEECGGGSAAAYACQVLTRMALAGKEEQA